MFRFRIARVRRFPGERFAVEFTDGSVLLVNGLTGAISRYAPEDWT